MAGYNLPGFLPYMHDYEDYISVWLTHLKNHLGSIDEMPLIFLDITIVLQIVLLVGIFSFRLVK